MHDLQYNGGKQVHAATGLIAACVHKSALSSSQPTSQSTIYLYELYTEIDWTLTGRWVRESANLCVRSKPAGDSGSHSIAGHKHLCCYIVNFSQGIFWTIITPQ